jgi:hypothetical protein
MLRHGALREQWVSSDYRAISSSSCAARVMSFSPDADKIGDAAGPVTGIFPRRDIGDPESASAVTASIRANLSPVGPLARHRLGQIGVTLQRVSTRYQLACCFGHLGSDLNVAPVSVVSRDGEQVNSRITKPRGKLFWIERYGGHSEPWRIVLPMAGKRIVRLYRYR